MHWMSSIYFANRVWVKLSTSYGSLTADPDHSVIVRGLKVRMSNDKSASRLVSVADVGHVRNHTPFRHTVCTPQELFRASMNSVRAVSADGQSAAQHSQLGWRAATGFSVTCPRCRLFVRVARVPLSASDLAIWRKNENSPGHPKGYGLGKVVDSWYSTGIPPTTPK